MQNIDRLCMGCMSEKGDEQVCSVCGFDSTTYSEPNALPLRTVLAGRYVVGKAVGNTGEGFGYLGFDTVTDSVVKITEYFPAGLCSRMSDGSVDINGATAFVFNEGILQFIDLHKKLGTLTEIPAVYRVIDIFEVNKTAYCVSEYLPGIPLKEFLIRNGGVLSWDQVRPLFLPLITAFRNLNENGIVHGGISPETLIVGRDGRIRIADFCIPAIRNARSEMTAQLFPGFAAIEQYRGDELTAATDVYGFAATMFRTLTGNPPPDSKLRLEKDNMTFPRSIAEQMPRSVLVAMANALQIEAADRTPTMAEFKADIQATDANADAASERDDDSKSQKDKKKKSGNKKYVLFAALATLVILGLIVGIIYFAAYSGDDGDASSSSSEYVTSTESLGAISASSTPDKQMSVPDFSGKSLAELLDNDEYTEWFEFKVVKKEYSNKVSKGKVCAQSVKIGTVVKKGTEVELTVSLGAEQLTIPKSLEGKTVDEALIELFKRGFEYDNIEIKEKMGSETSEENIVFETSPAMGEKISPDERLTIYYNANVVAPASSEPTGTDDFGYGYDY